MGKETILIVDDENDIRKLLKTNLEKEGYKVLKAEGGDKAIDKVTSSEIDCVILDIMMPGKDGYEVCREIRSRNYTMPIIFLTAKDEEVDEIVGLEMGGDDYIRKPFSVKTLLSRIKSNLRRVEYDRDDKQQDYHS